MLSADMLSSIQARRRSVEQPLWPMLEEALQQPATHCLRQLGQAVGMEIVELAGLRRLAPDFATLGYAEALRRQCLVAAGTMPAEAPICVTVDPFDLDLHTKVEAALQRPARWLLAHPSELAAYFAIAEGELRAIGEQMADTEAAPRLPAQEGGELSLVSIAEDASPVVKLVNSSIFDALKFGASDLHFEVGAKGMELKYRIDGVLSHVLSVPHNGMPEQVISRLKVMADLDIAERRVPQDGRFKMVVKGRQIDFRVSVMPSLFGEDVVVRVLDKDALADQVMGLSLEHLGFDETTLVRMRQLAREPYGMTLVTGPTGSGKTTTLYAALSEIRTGQDKIVTIEDPVEYQLHGILQIPVNERKGLTFAVGLRSILRHDPDKILVGEIRDPETALIAIQSALTGHQVFTSVHANNVFDVLGRFLHMGVDIYSFVSALNGVLAQRLVRMVCAHCTVPAPEDAAALKGAGREQLAAGRLVKGRGCGHCRGSGYKGRRAIGEFLRMNDELRELIIARAPIRAVKEAALRNGTRLLRDAALDAALAGFTTVEEVNRVTFSE